MALERMTLNERLPEALAIMAEQAGEPQLDDQQWDEWLVSGSNSTELAKVLFSFFGVLAEDSQTRGLNIEPEPQPLSSFDPPRQRWIDADHLDSCRTRAGPSRA